MVTTRDVSYDADGLTHVGHLARPEGTGPWPTVLLGHEGPGLNDVQRRRADHLAEQGFLTLAMDLHGGRYLADPQEMLDRCLPLLADPERMREIGRAALAVLLAEPGADPDRLAAAGWGTGGTVVLEMGRDDVPLRGIAAINPAPPVPRPSETARIRGAVLLGIGSLDPIVAPAGLLAAVGGELDAAGVDWRLSVYGGAEHAFHHPPTNPDGTVAPGRHHIVDVVPGVSFHPAQAARAWRDVVALLDETTALVTSVS
jgi:dienelactone hydrolase